jgi:hypothetical protein
MARPQQQLLPRSTCPHRARTHCCCHCCCHLLQGGINEKVGDYPKAQGCLLPMGVTSENVAAAYNITRRTQVRARC